MRLLFISPHAFLQSSRKTSVHFVSQALADRGHRVSTISVGYSMLTHWKNPAIFRALASEQRNRFVERSGCYRSACYMPLLHPFSSNSATLNRLTSLFFRFYGNVLPQLLKDELQSADIVLFEGGTSICFFDAIRRNNKNTRIVYFRRDDLQSIGASRFLRDVERRIAPLCDGVCVPSPDMSEQLPDDAKVTYLPQGVDKRIFDACDTSPYPMNTRNAVVVGDMLFDKAAVTAMAKAAPHVRFHLFGARISGTFPGNVTVYGERSFAETVPFIKFADFGIAPYKLTSRERYIAHSSLKLLQYSYCLLPIVVPEPLSVKRDNFVVYSQENETDWRGVIERALALHRVPAWREGILTWAEVSEQMESYLFSLDTAPRAAAGSVLDHGSRRLELSVPIRNIGVEDGLV